MFLAIGIEGSANKIGVGIVAKGGKILANVRETYSAPQGEGFIPKITAKHHREKILPLIQAALDEANVHLNQISLICYTKGPGMGPCLSVGAIVARTLAKILNLPISESS